MRKEARPFGPRFFLLFKPADCRRLCQSMLPVNRPCLAVGKTRSAAMAAMMGWGGTNGKLCAMGESGDISKYLQLGGAALNRGVLLYKEFIDHLVDMSSSCVDAACIVEGRISGIGNEEKHALLSRFSASERQILADIVLDAHHSAIYDVLDYLEWLQCCKKMTISIDGEILASKEFEGFSCDYIGRRSKEWDWPE